MCGDTAVIAGASVGGVVGLNLLGLGLLVGILHRVEKRERRKLAALGGGATKTETSVVTVENKGPSGGASGEATVVITSTSGSQVITTAPTNAAGAVLVSTAAAGLPGHTIKVDEGKTKVVTAEHPIGKPEEATIVSEKHQ